ncbi:MAG: anaerobic sulfatase maturase [Bacteroidota bacterium]|nr:anaerobic sulfatase maturase [Bacteroidota bacterium]
MKTTDYLFETRRAALHRPFPMMVKLAGPLCNLDCRYCYYIEKTGLYPDKSRQLLSYRMAPALLETIIRQTIEAQPGDTATFIWHGGEPTLAGLDTFREIVRMEYHYAGLAGKKVSNSLQTNGLLLDDAWCEFLAVNHFLCGISIDGPEKEHDCYRKSAAGKGTWKQVMNAIRLFHKHSVEFNTMTVVHDQNVQQPARLYQFLKDIGSHYMQFTPIVERIAEDETLPFSVVDPNYQGNTMPMEGSVSAGEFGNFLCRLFDCWVKQDIGTCFVNYFDATLAGWMGITPGLCTMSEYCPCSPTVEHSGDLFSCDHYVFPEYKLGNLSSLNLEDAVKCDAQLFFEEAKKKELATSCLSCNYLHLCHGDCPKNRYQMDREGDRKSVLCNGLYRFFEHTEKTFKEMAADIAPIQQ